MRTRNLLGAMVIGTLGVVAVSACGGTGAGAAAPSATASASSPAPSSTNPTERTIRTEAVSKSGTGHVSIPNGDRQVVVSVVDPRGGAEHPLLHIDDADRIDARGTGIGERTRLSFQPLEAADTYQIQTVRTRGSEPDCVAAQTDGTLRLTACDIDLKGQRFRLRPAGGDPARFTIEAAYGPVAVGDGKVFQDPDSDPWVLTAKDTGSYSNIYGD